MNNQSTPPIDVLVKESFMTGSGNGFIPGILTHVRAVSNHALQFSVLMDDGALYTGLPVSALATRQNGLGSALSEVQMWDAIDSSIEVFTIDLLREMRCSVKLVSGQIVEGVYKFTIDANGDGLSRHPYHWKMYHVVFDDLGRVLLYPQYRIQFLDLGLCPEAEGGFKRNYRGNTTLWASGS